MNKVMLSSFPSSDQQILSITELNGLAKDALEKKLGNVWVNGEISNLSKPASGHLYFSLKDGKAQIRCAMFRGTRSRLHFSLENGQQVLALAKVSLYEARGDYQLVINHIHLAGEGLLQIQYERLKKKLAASGLFAAIHKKDCPATPACIGVLTSSSGAAIRDILTVLKRRHTLAPVIVYPCTVQGSTAAAHVAQQIKKANQRQECDVLIIARGGGSLEDLWCFNDELLAHAIHQSTIPIITGIGHETDMTIADLVADQRAATPSAAAELASPDQREWLPLLRHHRKNLLQSQTQLLKQKHLALQRYRSCLRHPKESLQRYSQQLDQIEHSLLQTITNALNIRRTEFKSLCIQLNTLNPLNTLERGYAITYDMKQHLITSINQIKTAQSLLIQYQDGTLETTVKKIIEKKQ